MCYVWVTTVIYMVKVNEVNALKLEQIFNKQAYYKEIQCHALRPCYIVELCIQWMRLDLKLQYLDNGLKQPFIAISMYSF